MSGVLSRKIADPRGITRACQAMTRQMCCTGNEDMLVEKCRRSVGGTASGHGGQAAGRLQYSASDKMWARLRMSARIKKLPGQITAERINDV